MQSRQGFQALKINLKQTEQLKDIRQDSSKLMHDLELQMRQTVGIDNEKKIIALVNTIDD